MVKNKKRMITEVKQKADDISVLQLYIYGDVESCGDFNWSTWQYDPSETSAEYFKEILESHKDAKEIEIYINSYGGSVFEGTAIYNQLKRHPAHKTVYIDGFACSIAATIAMAGDTVIMPKNALMMIHNMWMSAVGNAEELRKAADDLEVINTAGRAAYMEKAGDKLKEDELVQMMDKETWLTAAECIEYGFADDYSDKVVNLDDSKGIMQKINLNTQQRINLQKTLAAQLRDITVAENKKSEGEGQHPEPSQKDKEPKEPSGMMKVIAGFF